MSVDFIFLKRETFCEFLQLIFRDFIKQKLNRKSKTLLPAFDPYM